MLHVFPRRAKSCWVAVPDIVFLPACHDMFGLKGPLLDNGDWEMPAPPFRELTDVEMEDMIG